MMWAIVLALALFQVTAGWLLQGGPGGPGGFGGFPSGHSGCISVHHYCPLWPCPNGFSRDTQGCELCHCADGSTVTDPSQQTVHHHIHDPCIPSQARCTVSCDVYMKGGSGCEFCMCDHSHNTDQSATPTTAVQVTGTQTTTTPSPTSAGNGTTASHQCGLATQICNAQCNGDYLVDPHDCTFCVCKSDLG